MDYKKYQKLSISTLTRVIPTSVMLSYGTALVVGTLIGACSIRERNMEHCGNNGGDVHCRNEHPNEEEHLWYCEAGTETCGAPKLDMYRDGCVPERPKEECYLACGRGGAVNDECKTATVPETTGTDTDTDTESSTGTDTETATDTEMTTEDSSSTGPEVCTKEEGDPLCKDPMKPYCVNEECMSCVDAGNGFCEEEIDPLKPACEPSTGTCEECVGDEHCTAENKVCGAENICVECTEEKKEKCLEKGLNACTSNGECVECVADTDCKDPSYPICGEMNECRGCEEHRECMGSYDSACHLSEKSGSKGSCFSKEKKDAIWVDKNGNCAENGVNVGSKEVPFCSLKSALDSLQGTKPRTVKLIGGVEEDFYAEQPGMSIGGGKIVAIIGIPNPNPPRVAAVMGLASISLSDPKTFVYFSEIHVSGSKTSGGIICGNGTEMWVSESQVNGNQGAGIDGTSCTVTLHESQVNGNQQEGDSMNVVGITGDNFTLLLDRSLIIGNDGGGIALTGTSTLKMSNSIVGGNGTELKFTRGLSVDGDSTFDILYSTIVANVGDSSIKCFTDVLGHSIRNSIVVSEKLNSIKDCNDQMGEIMVTTSALDTNLGQGNPLLKYDTKWFLDVLMGDFHLKGDGLSTPFFECARWLDGDPLEDMDSKDGDAAVRPGVNNAKDWCGADVPQ